MQSHAFPRDDQGFDHDHGVVSMIVSMMRMNDKSDEYECKMAKSWSSQGYEGLVSQT